MALYMVLEDWAGFVGGPSGAQIVGASTLLDSALYNIPQLLSDGCPLILYNPATMSAAKTAFDKQAGGVAQINPDGNLLALLYATGAIGGGSGLTMIDNRRDHSVNGARVDLFNTTQAILRTMTNSNPAGGFAGGGTGNKAILGHFLPAPMPLGALVSVEFTVLRLTPEQTALGVNSLPYINLVVELSPGLIVVMVFADVNNPLLLGAYSTPAPNQHRCVWTAASPGSGIMVVNDEGMATFPIPPGPILVPVSQGPAQTVAAAWMSHAYTLASIVAAYPGAMILNVYTADGGLPKSPTITSGVMMIIGSSTNSLQNAVQVLDWKLNGLSI